jgi:hypothetical protein
MDFEGDVDGDFDSARLSDDAGADDDDDDEED